MAATGFQSNQNRINRWSKKVMLFSAHPTNDLILLSGYIQSASNILIWKTQIDIQHADKIA